MDPRLAELLDPQDNSLGAFTFWLNETLYALSIRNVLSITQDNEIISAVPQDAKGLLGIIRYQGSPVTAFDFAARVGSPSGCTVKEQLIDKLVELEQAHITWVNDLEHAVENDVPFTGQRDHKLCQFGKWFYNFKARDENLQEIVQQFEQPHIALHALADKALALKNKDIQAARELIATSRMTTLRKLQHVFSQTRQQLKDLARPVILYATQNGNDVSIALRIDDVNNILTFDPKDFTPAKSDDQLILGCLCREGLPDCLLVNLKTIIDDKVVA